MSYRVETASTGRAGCRATECKDAGIKIDKDELRLGSWVTFEETGSWHWKHWGCVSGFQIQNIRKYLEDPQNPGTYRWDYLDGYEGDEKNSLDKHPDLQEKVRGVITQGFIDPEDWNGDPEMNKLGEKGLRSKETKKRMADEKRKGAHEIAELKAQKEALEADVAALHQGGASTSKLDARIAKLEDDIESKSPAKKKGPPKKRARAKEQSEDEENAFEEAKPVKKKRANKAKKEEGDDEEKPKLARKPRAKKFVKQEDEDTDEDEEVMPAPSKRARAKKRAKKEEVSIKEEQDAGVQVAAVPKKHPRGKKAVKREADENSLDAVEPGVKKEPAKKGRKNAVKDEPVDDAAGVESSNPGLKEASTIKNNPLSSTAVKGEPAEASTSISSIPDVSTATKGESAADSSTSVANTAHLTRDTKDKDPKEPWLGAHAQTILPGFTDDEMLYSFKHAYKADEIDGFQVSEDGDDQGEAWEKFIEMKKADLAAMQQPKKKGGRAKKAPAASSSSRAARGRTASKV